MGDGQVEGAEMHEGWRNRAVGEEGSRYDGLENLTNLRGVRRKGRPDWELILEGVASTCGDK
jgi:hypothetical protein